MNQNNIPSAFETKSGSADISGAVEELHEAFAAFRDTNDLRLGEIESRLSADVLVNEKLARIDRTIDETKSRIDRFSMQRARPYLAGEDEKSRSGKDNEHKAAFYAYMRSGENSGLKQLEEKALSSGSGPDGGYLVPQQAEREILQRLAAISPIRSVASVREISTAAFRKAFSLSGPAAGWVAEQDPRPQSANQQLADMNFPAMELYAMPAATQTLLDDAAIDVEQWVASEIDTVFAEQEGAAFVNGDGVNKPTGFLSYPVSTTGAWSWGSMAYVPTGVDGDFAASDPSDILVDLVYAAKAGYRQNARFVMNRKTQAEVRKLKTDSGDYIWAPPAGVGQPATLMNFPVVEAEDMPDIASDSFSIAFGDFQRGYLIVDRAGIRILRDPYSAKPYVLFYTTKRVGGGVQDFDAIKLLKFGTS